MQLLVSSSLPVTSGVPQGSILGPLLFVLYINDICDVCSRSVRLYADDAKIYRTIQTENDARILQNDLEALLAWSKLWKLKFNIMKCKCMSICRKLNVNYAYYLDTAMLDRVESFNDLGITVTTNFSWFNTIKSISAKAHSLE